MDPQLRRRPLPPGRVASGALTGHQSTLTPDTAATRLQQHEPPPPRYTRSATNLRAAHARPSTAVADHDGGRGSGHHHLPVNFVVDGLPTPRTLSPASTGEIRRVKSSSALSASLAPPPEANPPKTQSSWAHALGEAQYFAGGLVSRPAESTRHYTIIRHSHALVWYRGPATCVSITVLSDTNLPSTRTLWLQQKGYSGSVGMSLKALVGTTGGWLDVTPATRAAPGDLDPVDERGIQRDLRRFAKKASGRQKGHVARETLVVRIPAAATDGYFRLVLCDERKKVLCGCPVFRVASTSADASVVRGASIRTMPLEVGVKVGSTVAQTFVRKYTAPATMVVQNRATKAVAKAASNTAVKKATTYGRKATAVGKSVVQTSGLDQAVVESWHRGQGGRYDAVVLEENAVTIIGPDEGPEAPFPVSLEGKTARATGRSTEELGIPTANLRGVRDEIKMRWKGVYAAWASVVPAKGLEDVSDDWHEAIVTVGPLRHGPPEVVVKNRVTVHFLHDFDGAAFFDMKVRVVLMGYLHPPPDKEADPDGIVGQYMVDSMSVLESLARENWSIHDVVKRSRSFSERVDGMTGSVQGRVDRVPMHWVGVRSEGGAMRDKVYGNGGLWIPR